MLVLRARILINTLKQNPAAALLGATFALLLGYGAYAGTAWFLNFLDGFPLAGNVVADRTLGSLLLVLSSSVVLSALPNAVAVLYTSEDLPLLLSFPNKAWRVFLFKSFEVFSVTALVPALLTIPVLVAFGLHAQAPWPYYPVAVLVALALYAFPVAIGVGLALPLVRYAPAGRAREWSAAAGAVMGGLLIFLLRALRPEALIQTDFADPEALDRFLATFRDPSAPFLPSSLAQDALKGLMDGRITPDLLLLLGLSLGLLALAGVVAGFAYQQGWVRSLEGTVVEKPLGKPSWMDRLATVGTVWALWVRDVRLFFRDANQAAQLVLVGVLVLLYVTSLQFIPLEGTRFRVVVGFLHLAFQGFVIAGVGVRLAYPLLSLEGPGYWILQTAPVSRMLLLLSRFGLALFFLLPLGLLIGGLSPQVLGLGSGLSQISLLLGVSAALVAAALGVGLGFAFPRFDAPNPAEVPIGIGGLLYMGLSLLHSAGLVVLASRPVFLSFTQPNLNYLGGPEGGVWLLGLAAYTLLPAFVALLFGYRRMPT